jgi:hypothetical protein
VKVKRSSPSPFRPEHQIIYYCTAAHLTATTMLQTRASTYKEQEGS